jgi:hypothetical protein
MLSRLKSFDEVVLSLVNEEYVMKALDFALENNVHSMKISNFLNKIEKLKSAGATYKSELIMKRITEIKKVRFID